MWLRMSAAILLLLYMPSWRQQGQLNLFTPCCSAFLEVGTYKIRTQFVAYNACRSCKSVFWASLIYYYFFPLFPCNPILKFTLYPRFSHRHHAPSLSLIIPRLFPSFSEHFSCCLILDFITLTKLDVQYDIPSFPLHFSYFCFLRTQQEDHLKEPRVDGMIILKWILDKWIGSMK
jgi:hypothetical protein